MKIYLKDNFIHFEKRFYTLKCMLEDDYKPDNIPFIDEIGIEADDNEDIRKYIFEYCLKNNVHEYYVEIVGDNYLFDVDEDTERVESFVEDLLGADEAEVLDNDYKYVDYRMEIDIQVKDNQFLYVPTLILKFDTFSLNTPLIKETIQEYKFDSIEETQNFCEDIIQLFDLKSTRNLDYDYYCWYE